MYFGVCLIYKPDGKYIPWSNIWYTAMVWNFYLYLKLTRLSDLVYNVVVAIWHSKFLNATSDEIFYLQLVLTKYVIERSLNSTCVWVLVIEIVSRIAEVTILFIYLYKITTDDFEYICSHNIFILGIIFAFHGLVIN